MNFSTNNVLSAIGCFDLFLNIFTIKRLTYLCQDKDVRCGKKNTQKDVQKKCALGNQFSAICIEDHPFLNWICKTKICRWSKQNWSVVNFAAQHKLVLIKSIHLSFHWLIAWFGWSFCWSSLLFPFVVVCCFLFFFCALFGLNVTSLRAVQSVYTRTVYTTGVLFGGYYHFCMKLKACFVWQPQVQCSRKQHIIICLNCRTIFDGINGWMLFLTFDCPDQFVWIKEIYNPLWMEKKI